MHSEVLDQNTARSVEEAAGQSRGFVFSYTHSSYTCLMSQRSIFSWTPGLRAQCDSLVGQEVRLTLSSVASGSENKILTCSCWSGLLRGTEKTKKMAG